ncbi:MAG: RNA methyltransferase [Bacillota bacterium]
MQVINSQENSNLKQIRLLSAKKHRETTGLFVIEGIRAVRDAFEAGAEFEKVFVSGKVFDSGSLGDKFTLTFEESDKLFLLRDELFSKVTETETPQGVIAIVRQPKYNFLDIVEKSNKIIILEGIQDPGNLGTIIRTADAAGIDLVILLEGCVDIFNPKVVRSTMASIFNVPVVRLVNSQECFSELKKEGYYVVVTSGDANKSYRECVWSDKVAIVFGNEANGVSKEAFECAQESIKIDMPGKAESLNVAVAAGIIIFELIATQPKI